MAYDRDFNNVLAIWTAFNGEMGTNVGIDYEIPIYSVSYDLLNLTADGADHAEGGKTYRSILSVQMGYGLPDELTSVSMGGALLTAGVDYTYDHSTGEIVIPHVSDDIIITAEAKILGSFAFVINLADPVSLTYTIRTLTCSAEKYINWGDGTVERVTSTSPSHTYVDRRIYYVVIIGDITDLSFANGSQSSWMSYNALYRVLTPFPATMSENTDMSYRFCHCGSLVSIPPDVFYNCTAAENFSYCFAGCESLTIPAGIFRYNTEALSFRGLFYFCREGPTSIPAGLFDTNVKATDFYRCFGVFEALQSIPAGIFRYNTEAVNFGECFWQCWNLTSIPAGLFDSNTKAENFNTCFGNLRKITAIPEGLFRYNTAAIDFEKCFNQNYELESIPPSLFSTNTKVTSFAGCFSSCRSIETIPAGLFANNPLVTTFASCFSGCYCLASIPASLFANNPLVTTFASCFYGNYTLTNLALTSIPAGLFANNPAVTSFRDCFHYQRKVTSALPELWITHSSADGWWCFSYCRSASNYASVPDAWK